MSTTKKTYTKEFKEEAVRLAKQTGKRSQVARDLGIQVSMLRRGQLELEQLIVLNQPAIKKGETQLIPYQKRRLKG